MPGQMFASAEDHTTFAITSALERLCRGRAVAFSDAGDVWRGGEELWVVWGDEGGHVSRGGVLERRMCGIEEIFFRGEV